MINNKHAQEIAQRHKYSPMDIVKVNYWLRDWDKTEIFVSLLSKWEIDVHSGITILSMNDDFGRALEKLEEYKGYSDDQKTDGNGTDKGEAEKEGASVSETEA